MSIFNVISLLGGLALFLYGMNVMSQGLERASSGRLEQALEKMTSNVVKAILLGALVTAAIQSSSATTVIVVGLVNAKILKLRQAIGVIMGANIGTTITAHILRLTELEGSGTLALQFLKPSTLSPLAALIGVALLTISPKKIHKDIGLMLVGFSILFTGMFSMEAAMVPLQEMQGFQELFSRFSNPVLGVLVGAGVTALIQSSSASVGILQALAAKGSIAVSAAFPIIMGQNIGTCITPVLASIGASKNAKRTAFVHVTFNVVGTLVFLVGIYAIQYTVGFDFWDDPITKGGIANFHTLFNVAVTILFLPFVGLLQRLAQAAIKVAGQGYTDDEETAALDERFLGSPGFAIQHAREAVVTMAMLSLENFQRAVKLVNKFDKKVLEQAREVEDVIDRLQSKVDMYLLKLTQQELSETDSIALSEVLQVVNEFERIGDHDDNICDCAADLNEKGLKFSSEAMDELNTVADAVEEIIGMAVKGYEERDTGLAAAVEPLEEVINILVATLKVRHNERLRDGHCTVETAFPFVEILYNLERIADHCSNVGVHVISYGGSGQALDRHEFLRDMHQSQSADYKEKFDMYDGKYYERIRNITQ